jgi:hypothetical protein
VGIHVFFGEVFGDGFEAFQEIILQLIHGQTVLYNEVEGKEELQKNADDVSI